jgi:hypothetical protein
MCLCGMSRAYPEFYFTEEDIKKFAGRLINATKYLLAGRREQEALSKFIKNDL